MNELNGVLFSSGRTLAAASFLPAQSTGTRSRLIGGILITLLLAGGFSAAQQQSKPLDGQPWDYGFWAGGGVSVPGGTKDTQAINAGVRLGKVLTDDLGGSFVRGNFEWSADLMPIYYVGQPAPAKNAFGEAFNPVNLKWNFTNSPQVIPFAELGGGVLFTNHPVPLDSSRTNFLTHATFGLQFFSSHRRALTVNVLYQHISNAGLAVPNPGINTIQFQLGMNWFR